MSLDALESYQALTNNLVEQGRTPDDVQSIECGEATPDHRVLRPDLRAHLDHREPARLPYGLRHRYSRLGLGHPRVQRPFCDGDRAYGYGLWQGSTTQAAWQAPDLARQSPLVPGGSARTCRPRWGRGWLEYPPGRPRPEFGYAHNGRRVFPGLLHLPRQCAGRGDRVARVRPAPSTSRKERSERQPPPCADLGFVAPTAVVDGKTH